MRSGRAARSKYFVVSEFGWSDDQGQGLCRELLKLLDEEDCGGSSIGSVWPKAACLQVID